MTFDAIGSARFRLVPTSVGTAGGWRTAKSERMRRNRIRRAKRIRRHGR